MKHKIHAKLAVLKNLNGPFYKRVMILLLV